jgi:hypothetical protein
MTESQTATSVILAVASILAMCLVAHGYGYSMAAQRFEHEARRSMATASGCLMQLELIRLRAEALGLCEERAER